MKIGIVTTWFERGAAYVSKQYEEILNKEHEVFIYARGGEAYAKNDPKWNRDNVTWGLNYKYTTRAKINIKHFKAWVKNNSLDAIIFNEQHEWEPVLAADKMGVIIGSYIDYYKKDTVPFFKIYDFLLCNTQRHYSVFKDFFQSTYIPWGTDIDLFTVNKTIKIEEIETISFFHSAGMNPLRKGTDLILKAVHLLLNENFQLIIHSQVDLFTFFPELTSILKELLKSGKVKIIDKTIPAPGLYHLFDVYLYPSRLEGIGLTVPEAISCGLPTIATNQAPMNEFVKKNISGRLIDVERLENRSDNYYWPQSIVSLDSIRSQMLHYIKNIDKIEHFKKETRNYAVNELNWFKNASKLNQIINSFIKSPIDKTNIIQEIIKHESNRTFNFYLNTFRPYVSLKKRVKYFLKQN